MGDLTGPLNFVCPNMCLMRQEWQASRTEAFLSQHLGHEFTILRIRPVLNDKMLRPGFVVGCYLVHGALLSKDL
jgi:hypothetical protein